VWLHDVPTGFRIIPGMPVTADIKVGKRTVLGHLLGKVVTLAQEGMREP
jgi:HlyD family secretion protein